MMTTDDDYIQSTNNRISNEMHTIFRNIWDFRHAVNMLRMYSHTVTWQINKLQTSCRWRWWAFWSPTGYSFIFISNFFVFICLSLNVISSMWKSVSQNWCIVMSFVWRPTDSEMRILTRNQLVNQKKKNAVFNCKSRFFSLRLYDVYKSLCLIFVRVCVFFSIDNYRCRTTGGTRVARIDIYTTVSHNTKTHGRKAQISYCCPCYTCRYICWSNLSASIQLDYGFASTWDI